MADDLKDVIEIGADTSGVVTGIAAAKQSLDSLGRAAEAAGKRGAAGLDEMGKGSRVAAGRMDRDTRRLAQQIQRVTMEMEAGGKTSRQYFEALADQRGVGRDVLRPYLDQLDVARRKALDAEEASKRFSSSMGEMGRFAARFAAAFGAAFSLNKFITETVAAEQAQVQLAAVLRSTGSAAGWSITQLNAMAAQMSRTTSFSTDQITEAQTRLLSYTGVVGHEFPRAMKSVADMAARMNMDLSSAAESVGRALDVPSQGLTALSRQGFRFTEEQKAMVAQLEATGRVAEAQAIVLDALESSYGDAATAARDTLGGALANLRNAISDLMTGGDGSISALRSGVELLTSVVGDANAIFSEMKLATDDVAGSMEAAEVIADTFATAFETIAVLGVNTAYVLTGIGREIGGILAQARALVTLDFRGVGTIRSEMVADAEAARRQVDEVTARILSARGRARTPAPAGAADGIGAPDAAAVAKARAAKLAEETERTMTEARMKASGVNAEYVTQLGRLQAALASGAVQEKEYVEIVSALAKQTWESSTAGKEAARTKRDGAQASRESARATEREAQAFTSYMAQLANKIEAQELELEYGDRLTAADRARLDMQRQLATGRLRLSEADRNAAEVALQVYAANEKRLQQRAQEIAQADAYRSALMRVAAAEASRVDAIGDGNESLREEIRQIGLSRARQVEYARAKIDSALAIKQEQLARIQNGYTQTREMAALEEEIKLLEERRTLIGEKFQREESVEFWDSFESAAHSAFINIENGFESTVKQLWKSIKSGLLDMLWNAFAKPIVMNIRGVLTGVGGSLLGGGAALAAQVGGAGGNAGNLLSVGSNLASLGGVGGNMGALSGLVSGTMSLGNAIGSLVANSVSAATFGAVDGISALLATNGAYGTAVGAASGAAGGAAGALSAIPVWGWVAAAVLAIFGGSGAFSRKLKDWGVEGTLGGEDGFSGRQWQFFKGGLFRNDKTKTSALDAAVAEGIGDAWIVVTDSVRAFAETLGLEAERIDGFTTGLRFSLKDLKDMKGDQFAQAFQQKLNEALSTGSNELAKELIGSWEYFERRVATGLSMPGFWDGDRPGMQVITTTVVDRRYIPSEFARAGETAIETLTRLAGSLQMANTWFDTLGQTVMASALASGDLASKLMDAVGGMESFAALNSAYLERYYSPQEQRDIMARQLAAQLQPFGVALPDDMAAYRALYEQTQARYARGDESALGLLTTLLKLGQAFADMSAITDQLTAGAGQVREAWQSVADTLLDQVRRIRGEVAVDAGRPVAYWQSQFAIESAMARAGDQDAAGRLVGISDALLRAATSEADSLYALQRLRADVAQSLQDTAAYAMAYAGGQIAVGAPSPAGAMPSVLPAPAAPSVGAPVVVSSDPAVVDELRQLREMVAEQGRVITDLQLRGVRLLGRWDAEGLPAERVDP